MSHEEKIRTGKTEVLADDGGETLTQVNLRLKLDEVAEIEERWLMEGSRRAPRERELRALAERIYDARRLRSKVMGDQLFGEPAWDMLLALYCLPKRGLIITISGLSHCAEVPETTGLRWQKRLVNEGLIERGPDGVDQRKQIVRLTGDGKSLMDGYLTRLYYSDAAAPSRSPSATNVR